MLCVNWCGYDASTASTFRCFTEMCVTVQSRWKPFSKTGGSYFPLCFPLWCVNWKKYALFAPLHSLKINQCSQWSKCNSGGVMLQNEYRGNTENNNVQEPYLSKITLVSPCCVFSSVVIFNLVARSKYKSISLPWQRKCNGNYYCGRTCQQCQRWV